MYLIFRVRENTDEERRFIEMVNCKRMGKKLDCYSGMLFFGMPYNLYVLRLDTTLSEVGKLCQTINRAVRKGHQKNTGNSRIYIDDLDILGIGTKAGELRLMSILRSGKSNLKEEP